MGKAKTALFGDMQGYPEKHNMPYCAAQAAMAIMMTVGKGPAHLDFEIVRKQMDPDKT